MTLTLKARVIEGRLIVDERIDLPDGTEVQIAVSTDTDDLDDEDRARLHAAIERGLAEADRGEGIPAEELLAQLRQRPSR